MEGLLALGFLAFLGIYVMTSKPTAADRREAREDELAMKRYQKKKASAR